MIKIFDLFAGIGGFRIAAEKVFNNKINIKTAGWSEIDKYCQLSYNSNFINNGNYFIDDIKKITSKNNNFCNSTNYSSIKKKEFIRDNLPSFDLLFAGFPCQSFSSMGKQKGFEDERGALFFDIAAILHSIKPKYFILENVKRLLTIDNKKTFKTIISILQNENYDVSWWLLDSKDYGVPQTRRRIFIYGSLKKNKSNFPIDPPKISKKVTTTKSILEKNVDTKYILSKKILKTILKDGSGGYYSKSEIDLEIARPLTRTMVKMHRAHQDNYYSNKFINNEKKLKWIRRLTPLEALRLQGFPDKFYKIAKRNNVSDTQLYMQAGNSVTVNVVEAILNHLINHGWFR
jgi:DNA (cytosine-5)-methyltransferase 1